ncbi:MAG: hypothetical protein ACRYFX_04730 [Janthinobacterium lividum]
MTQADAQEIRKLTGTKIVSVKGDFPTFVFDNDATLRVECPWRLVLNEEYILVGEVDFQGEFTREEGMKILSHNILAKRVLHVEFGKGVPDLRVLVEGGLSLDIFVHSALYESWHLHIGQKHFSVIPGGELSVFTY